MNSLGLKSATQSRVNTSCHEGQATWLVSPVSLWGPWAYMPKICKVIDDLMCRMHTWPECAVWLLCLCHHYPRNRSIQFVSESHCLSDRGETPDKAAQSCIGRNNSITLPLREIYLCSTDIIISGFSNGFNENYPSQPLKLK